MQGFGNDTRHSTIHRMQIDFVSFHMIHVRFTTHLHTSTVSSWNLQRTVAPVILIRSCSRCNAQRSAAPETATLTRSQGFSDQQLQQNQQLQLVLTANTTRAFAALAACCCEISAAVSSRRLLYHRRRLRKTSPGRLAADAIHSSIGYPCTRLYARGMGICGLIFV